MARLSRIPHPPGDIFIQLHRWAIRAVGRDAAALLGHLDFLDRAQDAPGRPLATRAKLIADLEGLVSRNGVDASLRSLVELGWVRRHEQMEPGERNLKTWLEFSLHIENLETFLKNPGPLNQGSPGSPNGEAGDSKLGTGAGSGLGTKSGTGASPKNGTSTLTKEVDLEKEKEPEAAPASPSPAAVSDSQDRSQEVRDLNSFLDRLRANGDRQGGDLERDRETLNVLRELAAIVGVREVIRAAGSAHFPTEALKACRRAGLEESAAAVRKTAEEAAAERLRSTLVGRRFANPTTGISFSIINNGYTAERFCAGKRLSVMHIDDEFLTAIESGELVEEFESSKKAA